MIKNITTDELKRMTDVEGLILQGCGGDAQEWADGINKLFTEEGFLLDGDIFKDISVFEHDGLVNMLFSMEDVKLNVGKLAMWRLQSHDTFGGTWLSDYLPNRLGVDRDAQKEQEHEEGEPEVGDDDEVEAFEAEDEDIPEVNLLELYVGNVHDEKIEAVVIPLPITPEALQPILDKLEVTGWQDLEIIEVISDVNSLSGVLYDITLKTLSQTSFDELNYLAARLEGLDEYGLEIFEANVEIKKNIGSFNEIVNLTFTENINCFDLFPVFDERQYGEILVDSMNWDKHADAITRLAESENPQDNELAKYVEKLEKHTDHMAFGVTTAKEEGGVFTDRGYLTGGDGLQEIYKGIQDIPDEYRIFTKPGEMIMPIIKLDDVNIPAELMKLHAVCGVMDYAEENMRTLLNRQDREYLLLIDKDSALLSTIADAYKRDTEAGAFISLSSKAPEDTIAFAIRVNSRESSITGDFIELNTKALCDNISRHAVAPDRIEAVFSNGAERLYDLWSWYNLPPEARDDIIDFNTHFQEAQLKETAKQYSSFMGAHELSSVAVETDVFMKEVNAAYMEKAGNPQSEMLRIPNEVAKELLARGDADVYALMENSEKRLEPFEALRPLCFAEHKELAIKSEALPGLDKWAERKVNDLNRKAEKDKTKEKAEEL